MDCYVIELISANEAAEGTKAETAGRSISTESIRIRQRKQQLITQIVD
jgi:hypothetical protein